MKPEYFIRFLNQEGTNFSDYNMHSMYIIRGGNFINIKNLFKMINDCYVNIGRGGPQKAHVLSPLDFRLSCYLMALFNFNNNLISSLNTFNDLSKDRYLPYIERHTQSNTTFKNYRSITIDKMPLYSKNKNIGQYSLECKEVNNVNCTYVYIKTLA